jgi:hypothetical protein
MRLEHQSDLRFLLLLLLLLLLQDASSASKVPAWWPCESIKVAAPSV